MEQWMFGMFLAVAAGQDLKKKRVDLWIYLLFGGLALIAAANRQIWGSEGYPWMEHVGGISLGLVLFGIGMVSRGGVGIGDGCFFLVSGMLLGFRENMLLLCYGTLLCGLYCLVYLVWMRMHTVGIAGIRRKIIPFLPFLVPPGIWILLYRFGG